VPPLNSAPSELPIALMPVIGTCEASCWPASCWVKLLFCACCDCASALGLLSRLHPAVHLVRVIAVEHLHVGVAELLAHLADIGPEP
jgi:hypothetical protein